ncbi:hypothetical protein BHE74_00021201 [Ensete ventricosum]|nr:hypothetical protein BHE74_00021201 [Ensete ventricosum]
MAPSLPFKHSDMTKKLDASPAPSPVVLTCEDLEQLILTDTKGSSSNLQHVVQGTWMTKDGKLERQKSDVDDHASQHLLSLLQKGTKKEKEMVSVTSALEIGSLERFSITDTCFNVNLGIVESNSCNSETVSSSEKTLTLEALFGSAFMSELQSAQAPVSVQRVVDDGVKTTAIPTSLGLPFPSSDVQCILGVGKEQRNSPIEDLKFSGADFEEKAPETHLPDEHSLISVFLQARICFPLCIARLFFLTFVIFSFCFQHAGSLVGSGGKNHPEAFQRLIEMEQRANAKQVHPAAAGNIPDMCGPELGMSFRYR